jgi:hypothetical protein
MSEQTEKKPKRKKTAESVSMNLETFAVLKDYCKRTGKSMRGAVTELILEHCPERQTLGPAEMARRGSGASLL